MMKKIAGTTKDLLELNLETGKDLTMVYCKSDTVLLVYASLKFKTDVSETYGLDPFNFICLPGYFDDGNLCESKQEVEYLRKKIIFQLKVNYGKCYILCADQCVLKPMEEMNLHLKNIFEF